MIDAMPSSNLLSLVRILCVDASHVKSDPNFLLVPKQLIGQIREALSDVEHPASGHETTAGATDWERARDVVAEVVRGLGGEARIGATLALQAISEAMIGTPASPEKASAPLPGPSIDEIRDLGCCDQFVRESASEFCATCGYTNVDHLRKRASAKVTVYETCSRCGGSGLGLNMAGEPDECPQCKGNAVCAQNGTVSQK